LYVSKAVRHDLEGMKRILWRVHDSVEYRVARSDVEKAIRMWRSVDKCRGGGVAPRGFFKRVGGVEVDSGLVASHRSLLFSMYAADPAIGRLIMRRAGRAFADVALDGSDGIEDATHTLARLGIGLFDFIGCKRGVCVFRVYECISCSGLPRSDGVGDTICEWEAGIIESIMERVFRARPVVQEVKCWVKGDSYCEFHAMMR